MGEKVTSKYDLEISQSQTTGHSKSRGRDTATNSKKTNKVKLILSLSLSLSLSLAAIWWQIKKGHKVIQVLKKRKETTTKAPHIIETTSTST